MSRHQHSSRKHQWSGWNVGNTPLRYKCNCYWFSVHTTHGICIVNLNLVFHRIPVGRTVTMLALKTLCHWNQREWKTKVSFKKIHVLRGKEKLLNTIQVEVRPLTYSMELRYDVCTANDFPHFLSALASNNPFIPVIKLVKMWPGGTGQNFEENNKKKTTTQKGV